MKSIMELFLTSAKYFGSIRPITCIAVVLISICILWLSILCIANQANSIIYYHRTFSSGWFSGSLHAITGSDHLASLLPIILSKGWRTGIFHGLIWGFGHGLTSFFLGITALYMKAFVASPSSFPSDFIQKYHYVGDVVTALTILIIGLMGVYENFDYSFIKTEGASSEDGNVDIEKLKINDQTNVDSTTVLKNAVRHENMLENFSSWISKFSSSKTVIGQKSISTKYAAIWYDCFKVASVFIHGCAMGFSLDGLPSLTPAVVLKKDHVIVFLLSYWFSTAVIMCIASAIVAEVSLIMSTKQHKLYFSSKWIKKESGDTEAASNKETDEDIIDEPDYENRLARVASIAALMIGIWYLLLSSTRLYLQYFYSNSTDIDPQSYVSYFMSALSVPMLLPPMVSNDGLAIMNDGTESIVSVITSSPTHLVAHNDYVSNSSHSSFSVIDICWALLSLIGIAVALVYGLGSDIIFNVVLQRDSIKHSHRH